MGRCSVDGVTLTAHRPAKATHILVPVDDSQDSEDAVLWALENVWKDEEFHLMHCIANPMPQFHERTPAVAGTASGMNADPSVLKADVETARAMIERRFVPMLKERDIPFSIDIYHTEDDTKHIAQRICDEAEKLHVKAVVISHHQRSKLAEFFHGSVSKYIQKYSHQPVIVLDERIRKSIDVQRASLDKGRTGAPVPEFKSTFA